MGMYLISRIVIVNNLPRVVGIDSMWHLVRNRSTAQNRESCYVLFATEYIGRCKISKIRRVIDRWSSGGGCSYGEASRDPEADAGEARPAYRIDSRRHLLRRLLLYDR